MLRTDKRYPIRSFAPPRQISRGAISPDHRGSPQPVQSLAVMDHLAINGRACSLAIVLPPPRLEALQHQHPLPVCFLHLQHHRYLGWPDILSSDVSPFKPPRRAHRIGHGRSTRRCTLPIMAFRRHRQSRTHGDPWSLANNHRPRDGRHRRNRRSSSQAGTRGRGKPNRRTRALTSPVEFRQPQSSNHPPASPKSPPLLNI